MKRTFTRFLAALSLVLVLAACGQQELLEKPQVSSGQKLTQQDLARIKTSLEFDENHLLVLSPDAKRSLTPLQHDFALRALKRLNWLARQGTWQFGSKPDGSLFCEPLQARLGGQSWCGEAVDSIWWDQDPYPSLAVIPTWCGRTADILTYWDDWVEVVDKTPVTPFWDKSYGSDVYWSMHDQFLCHAQFAKHEEEWNLEPYRPNVEFAELVNSLCNPGSPAPS